MAESFDDDDDDDDAIFLALTIVGITELATSFGEF